VSAQDQASGQQLDVNVRTRGGLSKAEIDRLQSRFDTRSAEQREAATQEIRDELQMLVFGVRKALEGVSSVLTAEEHAEIVRTLADAQRSLADESHELQSARTRLFAAADLLSQARQRLEH
jgi:molecular chaperone DnaK (HSP70)